MSEIKTNRFGNPYGGNWTKLDARGKGMCRYNAECECYEVWSYGTLVARFNLAAKTVERLWSGYSATTLRHIESFCGEFPVYFPVPFRKAFWDSLEVRKPFCWGRAEDDELYEMAGLRRRAA